MFKEKILIVLILKIYYINKKNLIILIINIFK